jgi:hypothetical protein
MKPAHRFFGITDIARAWDCATAMILCRNLQPRRPLCWPIAPGGSVPIIAGDTFVVHYSDLDQLGLADTFNALVDEKIIAIIETGISPAFH